MGVTIALITDTFREAVARKIFLGLFGLATLTILFFLFVMKIDVVEGAMATVSLFGIQTRGEMDTARLLQGAFAGVSGFLYTVGMFLAVFASAGLIPSVLEPGRIELILSKPVSRLHILLGRFAGNVLIVLFIISYLVLGVWLILSMKTGIWQPGFLWTIFFTVSLFSVLLTVVTFIGVLWESTALATMVTVALMIVSPILAQERTMNRLLSSEWSRQLWKGLYYVLPKVYDTAVMSVDMARLKPVESWWPIWTSMAFGAVVLTAGLAIFHCRDF
jgi:ABC-2 type transport system permease protein